MMNSIWASSDLPTFGTLDRDLETEVLIIGGGMAGILCARELHAAGADYLLIEADRIAGGVTRNTTAKITSQHGLVYSKLVREFDEKTARGYYDANQQALKRLQELSQSIDCDFQEKENYLYTVGDKGKLEEEYRVLKDLKIPADWTDCPALPFPVTGAIRFPKQAQFHPLKFLAGIAKDLNICEGTRAWAFAGNRVLTNHGRIRAKNIIVATHFPILNKHGGYFLKLYQQRSYVLALENAGDVAGMYLDAAENGLSLRNQGNLLLLGGGGHRTGKQGGGWETLEAFARKYYPGAKECARWATQDCMSLDGIPYIGQYGKRTSGLFVATGFNKWGMTSSMAAAMLLKDLVQGRENPYERMFDPSRQMLRPQLFANGAESVGHLLKPTRPRCPHLGCALEWNPRERSWDCPCHGSRFSQEGKLLDNPATGNLKKP